MLKAASGAGVFFTILSTSLLFIIFEIIGFVGDMGFSPSSTTAIDAFETFDLSTCSIVSHSSFR